MALVQCSECKNKISDQAAACPNCGAPMKGPATASPPSKGKKKTSQTTWVALFLVIGGIVWYLQSRQFREQNLPPMPVEVSFRGALLGPGLVLQLKNKSSRHLSIMATLKNPSTQQGQNYRLDVAPQGTTEVGHKEGWTLASGDNIELFHNDYQSWKGNIP